VNALFNQIALQFRNCSEHRENEGKSLGRPKRIFGRQKARILLQTMSIRQAARQLGVSRGVVERELANSYNLSAD